MSKGNKMKINVSKPAEVELLPIDNVLQIVEKDEVFTAEEKVPSSWNIFSNGELIFAVNRETQKIFKGSIKDFNLKIRT